MLLKIIQIELFCMPLTEVDSLHGEPTGGFCKCDEHLD